MVPGQELNVWNIQPGGLQIKVVKQWRWLPGAENCVHAHGSILSACHLYYGLPIVLSPSGLISKVALLYSDCEKNVYIIIHCLVLYQRVFGKYGCKLCFYVLMECFIKKKSCGYIF